MTRNSSDYWLPHLECPACERCDHEHCDPDRSDCPSLLCECQAEVLVPKPRTGE